MKATSFVTGPTGSVGLVLVKELVSSGHDVIALVRSKEKRSLLPEEVKCLIGDINDLEPDWLEIGSVDYVFHLAAITGMHPHCPNDPSLFHQVNVEGTRNIARIAKQIGARRFVYFSTIDVYGKRIQGCADENHETMPSTLYGETKLMAEKVVQEVYSESDENTGATILRLAAVYGPNMKGNYPKLVKALYKRRFIPIGRGANRRTLVFERDAARAAILSAGHPAASGKTYNVSDGKLYTVKEIVAAICDALNRKPPAVYIPENIAILGARAADRLSLFMGKEMRLAEAVEKYSADVAVISELIRRELGYLPEYDLTSGWRETINEWERSGIL